MAKRQEIENLNSFIEEQTLHYENVLEDAKEVTTSYISDIFNSLDVDGIVLEIDDNNNIKIAISPEAKSLIMVENMLSARIKLEEVSNIVVENSNDNNSSNNDENNDSKQVVVSDIYIEGTIVPDINGSYYFELAKDADGNPIPVDFSFIKPGIGVNLVREIIN